jgi:hypothetical protein
MRDIVALFFSFYQSSYVIKRDKEGKRVSLNAPILDYIEEGEEMKARGIIIIAVYIYIVLRVGV